MVINSPCLTDKKELAIPGQTATGKEFSNPLMAGSLPKTITCLEKSDENAEFHQIVDFLSTCSINYALTVSPTIYASYIEQFWNTATSKIINYVKQIHAIVDGKVVVISESSVRSDLLFNDEDGVTYLTNDEIFENLALIGYKQLSTKLTFQKDKDFEELDDNMENVEEETVDAVTTGVSTAAVTINVEDSSRTVRPVRSITTLQSLPTIDPKDKGKGVLVKEEPMKIKKKDQGDLQIQADAELAQRLHEEELAELEMRQKERVAQEEASMAALYEEYDTIQASIDADALWLQIQSVERKDYKEIHGLYERQQKKNQDFIPMDTEVINDSGKKNNSSSKPAGGSRKKTLTRKRAGENKSEESAKKQKLEDVVEEQESAKSDEEAVADYEHEKEVLRMWLTVVSNEEETVDPNILSAKYPIVDWESQNLGSVDMEDLHVYKIIKADRNTSYHKSLSSMLRKFNRQDLVDLHRLVMKRFEDTTPEGYNLLLWGDLKVMFEPNAEDEIWIEKRYPLIKEMLQKMLNWKLEAEAESTMAFELLKFIKSQLEE
ncbi:hypothetical protein Tco_0659730 [Tanacetum coccineum]